ncbi:uncharacterized protein LOC143587879 [Bidens hawaiensis]|uniref:uncharacterized protein LOC143587879 n=1 Tax=Bidens hawaiensis TaxID=980011 RepID=UPI0040499479
MDADRECENLATLDTIIKETQKRCEAVMDTIESLANLSLSCKRTLTRLVQSELAFLSRLSSTTKSEPSVCLNIGHIESVVHILQQPNISGVSRVCKTIGLQNTTSKHAHVDIVCTFEGNPVWFIVSDRNPKYISWYGQQESPRNKGLRDRIQLLLEVAHNSVALKPFSIIFFFSNGLDRFTLDKFLTEFEPVDLKSKFSNFDFSFSKELEGEWIDILARSYQQALVLEIKVNCPQMDKNQLPFIKPSNTNLTGSFGDLISQITSSNNGNDGKTDVGIINFDTTALVATVSGISNGGTQKLLDTPDGELKARFKGNTEFVINQVLSEIENPIHVDILKAISGRKCVMCESVCAEFKELVLMCGGVNEKLRAEQLIKVVVVVPDCPSGRMMSLPTTRKLGLKNKIVFGTGDYWRAPTLTANMGFVRAVSQTGMSLFTFEHRPRALTGD